MKKSPNKPTLPMGAFPLCAALIVFLPQPQAWPGTDTALTEDPAFTASVTDPFDVTLSPDNTPADDGGLSADNSGALFPEEDLDAFSTEPVSGSNPDDGNAGILAAPSAGLVNPDTAPEGEVPNRPPYFTNPDQLSFEVDEDSFYIADSGWLLSFVADPDDPPLEDEYTFEIGDYLPDEGILTLNEDGSFMYEPLDDFYGEDWFTVRVRDSLGAVSEEVAVWIQVNPVNDRPVAEDKSFVLSKHSLITDDQNIRYYQFSFSAYDLGSDIDGDEITFELNRHPVAGFLVNNGDGTWSYRVRASLVTGSFTDNFTYNIYDGSLYSETGTVTIKPPVTSTDQFAIEGERFVVDLRADFPAATTIYEVRLKDKDGNFIKDKDGNEIKATYDPLSGLAVFDPFPEGYSGQTVQVYVTYDLGPDAIGVTTGVQTYDVKVLSGVIDADKSCSQDDPCDWSYVWDDENGNHLRYHFDYYCMPNGLFRFTLAEGEIFVDGEWQALTDPPAISATSTADGFIVIDGDTYLLNIFEIL